MKTHKATLRQLWGTCPDIMRMVRLVGVDPDAMVNCYVDVNCVAAEADATPPWEQWPHEADRWSDQDRAEWLAMRGNEGKTVDELDTSGLTSYVWEEGDELHLDGKVLWTTSSARFYGDVYLRQRDVDPRTAEGHHLMEDGIDPANNGRVMHYVEIGGDLQPASAELSSDGDLCRIGQCPEHMLTTTTHERRWV